MAVRPEVVRELRKLVVEQCGVAKRATENGAVVSVGSDRDPVERRRREQLQERRRRGYSTVGGVLGAGLGGLLGLGAGAAYGIRGNPLLARVDPVGATGKQALIGALLGAGVGSLGLGAAGGGLADILHG